MADALELAREWNTKARDRTLGALAVAQVRLGLVSEMTLPRSAFGNYMELTVEERNALLTGNPNSPRVAQIALKVAGTSQEKQRDLLLEQWAAKDTPEARAEARRKTGL